MAPRNDRPHPPPPALYNPLGWAGGGLLLTMTVLLTGMGAVFRGIGSLFY